MRWLRSAVVKHEPSPAVAAALSFLIPGLGQIYRGQRAQGFAIVCVAAGVAAGALASLFGPASIQSPFTAATLAIVYACVWLPAVLDAARSNAKDGGQLIAGRSRAYVVLMLVTAGPMALPLLWQSPAFSRGAKIFWTVGVVLLAFIAIWSVMVVGPLVDEMMGGGSF